MLRNQMYATSLGKISLKRQQDGWEVKVWRRCPNLSWKSMRCESAEMFPSNGYDLANMQALSHYEVLLHETKRWCQEQQGINHDFSTGNV